jgi:thymidylate synthase ThyX
MYEAKILADSLAAHGQRLTTMQITFPRMILAEFNTHRMFSRNSASSRAIPVEKMLQRVREQPFVPAHWGKNQKGMQAEQELGSIEEIQARAAWDWGRQAALATAERLLDIGVHKQIANRLLEPFLWHTAIVSATDWENFFNQRTHKDAQPEMQQLAMRMQDTYSGCEPRHLAAGDWHLPLTPDLDDLRAVYDEDQICRISAARCARVSYLTHAGEREPAEDLGLFERLLKSGHMSPLEHVARAQVNARYHGNFNGFLQLRKTFPSERVFAG